MLVATSLRSLAQLTRSSRVVWLTGLSAPNETSRSRPRELFVSRLRELGWIEGRNLELVALSAADYGRPLDELLKAAIALRPDLLIAPGSAEATAARAATTQIPIVFTSADPVGLGLVASLARPGGNATGVAIQTHELVPKAMSLLREFVPNLKRVDVLSRSGNPINVLIAKASKQAAAALRIESHLIDVHNADEMEAAIATTPADAIVATPGSLFLVHRQRMAAAALRRGVPLVDAGLGRDTAVAGCLFSYGMSMEEVNGLLAEIADRALRGVRPDEIPVRQTTRFRLVINLKTAQALSLTLPKAQLLRADEVIE